MKTIDLELSNKILKSNIEALESKISELKSEIKDLKSDIDYFECQNKVLRINNENLESDIMDYKVRIDCLSQKLVEKQSLIAIYYMKLKLIENDLQIQLPLLLLL